MVLNVYRASDFLHGLPGDRLGFLIPGCDNFLNYFGPLFEVFAFIPNGGKGADQILGHDFFAVHAPDCG